ncbi:MAG: pyridoxamine 5'-phosphate oxidase family protein [Planctomycetes bacterium]|nr:pyridoxamine 5'-phosphate oxidase family protein [Planctomycetota bacterium]
MLVTENWAEIKKLFRQSFKSSFHYAIATVKENGEPHVTPIGSLILRDLGHGFYFEEFTRQLPINFQNNKQVCILAVNSSRWFWIKSLFSGRFSSPPAIRLFGTVGEVRKASEKEIYLWHQKVRKVRSSKGFAIMWKNMSMVRDIDFSRVEPVYMGEMTHDIWGTMSKSEKSIA